MNEYYMMIQIRILKMNEYYDEYEYDALIHKKAVNYRYEWLSLIYD